MRQERWNLTGFPICILNRSRQILTSDDVRYVSSSMVPGGVFFEMLRGGVPPGHRNPSYQRHLPIQLILWEYDPRALKRFAFASLDQQELVNVT